MELSVQNSDGKYILYKESPWTGRRKLFIDGKEAVKVAKKTFRVEEEEGTVDYTIKGSFISGVSVSTSKGENIVLAKNAWYDWLFICLPYLGVVFGVAFCGALGGGLSAFFCTLAAIINANISRCKLSRVLKILVQIIVTIIANAIWFVIYFVIATFILASLA